MTETLPITKPIEAAEWLPSYLLRLVWHNRYPSMQSILRHLSGQSQTSEWFEELARFTDQDAGQLIRSSTEFLLSRTDADLEDVERWLNHDAGDERTKYRIKKKRGALRNVRDLAYCPACLSDSPYLRLHWIPRLSVVCVGHQRYLESKCPHCGAQASLSGVVFGTCRQCYGLLRYSGKATDAIDDKVLHSQRVLQSWFGADESELHINAQDLPQLSPATQFMLVDGFQEILHRMEIAERGNRRRTGERPQRANRAAPPTIARHIAQAFEILQDWPNRFHGFVRALKAFDESQTMGNKQREGFPNLIRSMMERTCKHERFHFLHEEFDTFLANEYQFSLVLERSWRYKSSSNLRDKVEWVSLFEAARHLHVNVSEVARVSSEHNVTRKASGSSLRGGLHWVSREYLRWLQQALGAESYTLPEAARLAGTSERTILRLVELRRLLLVREDNSALGQAPLISGSSMRLLDSALCHLMMQGYVLPDSAFVTLEEAVNRLSRYGIDEAAIIDQVLSHRLHTKGRFLSLCDWFKIARTSVAAMESWLRQPETRLLNHSRNQSTHLSVEKRLAMIRKVQSRAAWAVQPE